MYKFSYRSMTSEIDSLFQFLFPPPGIYGPSKSPDSGLLEPMGPRLENCYLTRGSLSITIFSSFRTGSPSFVRSWSRILRLVLNFKIFPVVVRPKDLSSWISASSWVKKVTSLRKNPTVLACVKMCHSVLLINPISTSESPMSPGWRRNKLSIVTKVTHVTKMCYKRLK